MSTVEPLPLPSPREVAKFLRENAVKTSPGAFNLMGALVTLTPAEDAKFFSASKNTAGYLAVADDLDSWSVSKAVELVFAAFKAAGAPHCYFVVHPSPAVALIKSSLLAFGFHRMDSQRFTPEYPTLIRSLAVPWPEAQTDLELKRLPRFPGDAEFATRFGMFDGPRCVAHAAVHVMGDYALLTGARTDESHHRRGAQQALIAARLAHAKSVGCKWAVSETLSILKSSLNNLQRFGFETLFYKPIYEWRRQTDTEVES